MIDKSSSVVSPQSNPDCYPVFTEFTHSLEQLVVRWWRQATEGESLGYELERSWCQVADWCHGAAVAVRRIEAGTRLSDTFSFLCDIAAERGEMEARVQLRSAGGA